MIGELIRLPRSYILARSSAVRRSALSARHRVSPGLRAGAVIVLCVVLVSIFPDQLAPYAPDQVMPSARLLEPSLAHPFGTDNLGRDLFSRIVYGARVAVRMALLSVGLSVLVGSVAGGLTGYYGGWLDFVVSRLMEVWLSLPGALVAIVIVARLGSSLDNLILALGIMGVPVFYRLVRATTLSARRACYVEAAETLGASDLRILRCHVLPNIASPLVVQTTLRLGIVLLTGGGLSFLGLGAQPPIPEWGALLASGRSAMDTAWWLAVFPGLAITVTVTGLNLLGDGLRDVLDPTMRGRPRGGRYAN